MYFLIKVYNCTFLWKSTTILNNVFSYKSLQLYFLMKVYNCTFCQSMAIYYIYNQTFLGLLMKAYTGLLMKAYNCTFCHPWLFTIFITKTFLDFVHYNCNCLLVPASPWLFTILITKPSLDFVHLLLK